MQQIAANVWVETAFRGCNVSFVTTGDGVVMVDTPMRPSDAIRWREIMHQAGDIRYLINTEHHIDHVLGNHFFPATVVSQEGTRSSFAASLGSKEQVLQRVREIDPDAMVLAEVEAYEPRPPQITFSDRLKLYAGGQVFELMHLPGHTPNEIAVYAPNESTVFTGDNVTTVPPYFRESCPIEWVQSLEKLLELDAQLYVPGHGDICGKEGVRQLAAFLQEGIEAVKQAIARGESKEEAARTVRAFARYPQGAVVQEVDSQRQQQV